MGFFLRHPQALAAPLSFRKMFRSYDGNRKAASCTIRLQALPLRSDSEIRGARAIGGIFECLCGGICFATDLPLQKGTPVHLVFAMPEEISHKPAAEWHCTGHVVHVQPGLSPQGAICAGVAFDCYEVFPLAEDRASNAC